MLVGKDDIAVCQGRRNPEIAELGKCTVELPKPVCEHQHLQEGARCGHSRGLMLAIALAFRVIDRVTGMNLNCYKVLLMKHVIICTVGFSTIVQCGSTQVPWSA